MFVAFVSAHRERGAGRETREDAQPHTMPPRHGNGQIAFEESCVRAKILTFHPLTLWLTRMAAAQGRFGIVCDILTKINRTNFM